MKEQRKMNNSFLKYSIKGMKINKSICSNHRRNEEKLMPLSLNYQRDEQKQILFVPKLSKEGRRSKVFVPQLSKEQRRSEVFILQLLMIDIASIMY